MSIYVDTANMTSGSRKIYNLITKERGGRVLIALPRFSFSDILLFSHFISVLTKNDSKKIYVGIPSKFEILKSLLPHFPFYILRHENVEAYNAKFNIVINIDPEPFRNYNNNDLFDCLNSEIFGIDNFILEPVMMNVVSRNKRSDKVGGYFLNNNKLLDSDIIDSITDEIVDSGLDFNQFYYNLNDFGSNISTHKPKKTESFNVTIHSPFNSKEILNLMKLVSMISECKYFIGVESDMLLLAYMIIGYDNCIILDQQKYFKNTLSFFNNFIDISRGYISGSTYDMLEKLYTGRKS